MATLLSPDARLGAPLAHARANAARWVEDVAELVRLASVSSDPRYAPAMRECAAWLAARLRRAGLEEVDLLPTSGHPVVRGAWRRHRSGPTLLVYGHYDVQPPGPPNGWHTPPFEPNLQDSYLYGRGASDDKGPLMAHIAALESWLAATGSLPLNVVCIFDGDEEVGSQPLTDLLFRRPDLFAAQAAVVSDTLMPRAGQPAITVGLRGMLGLELEVRAPQGDLHPGNFGGATPGSAHALARLLARLHDRQGRVVVPGFYARVRPVAAEERANLARIGARIVQLLGSSAGLTQWGEPGFSVYERTVIRPALSVTGLASGPMGAGHLAAIPAQASARLDVRLVPDQDPSEIERLVQQFVRAQSPPGLHVVARTRAMAPPAAIDPRHPVMAAGVSACCQGFGSPPVFIRSGGTLPIVGYLGRQLGIPVVCLGLSLPDDGRHAPNERLHLPTFERGVAAAVAFLAASAERLRP